MFKVIFLSCVVPQNSDVDAFQSKVTPLDSKTLSKLRQIFDYRCIVGGGEQIFLLALGVGLKGQGFHYNLFISRAIPECQLCAFFKTRSVI